MIKPLLIAMVSIVSAYVGAYIHDFHNQLREVMIAMVILSSVVFVVAIMLAVNAGLKEE